MSRPITVSKDRTIFAVGNDNELKVKNIRNDKSTSELLCSTKSEGSIQMIKISPNNAFTAWITKQPIEVCIESLLGQKSSIRISNDKAEIGFQTIIWSLDSRFLLIVSKLSVYIDVINVTEKTVFKITGAVVDSYKNCVCSFSPDGYYFASAERSHPATVNVYTTDNWTKIQVLKVRGISNIGGMIWCLDSMSLVVWQSLTHYQLTHCTLDGRIEHETKKDLVVVCNVTAAPNGRLIGIQSDDFKVTIVDLLTWHEVAVFEHDSMIPSSEDVSILKENYLDEQENESFLQTNCIEVKDHIVTLVASKHMTKPRRRKLSFSPCSSYLASYEPQLGEALWIWNLTKKGYLHSVIMLDEETSTINKIIWHPSQLQLIVDIAVNKILIWDLEKCVVIKAKDKATTIFTSDLYLATLNSVHEHDDNGS